MGVAIKTENLGKQYRIHHEENMQRTFVETVSTWFTSPLRRFQELRGSDEHQERFWALRDVNLQIEEGEIVGLIGRNGAGKSTLLKILSRITWPTTGKALIRGRIGSLLEVGTGFHPELTGRENIFLNGAILGMRRDEIRRKFDEIVAFAEVEKFLDTPVKRYSSGMRVRLAFAVAAHLEPEILLVDEVLAVGDAAFQKKCLGRMGDVARSGRTVVYVSHNLPTILSLTKRCLCIDGGQIRFDGSPENVVADYLRIMEGSRSEPLESRTDRTGSGRLRFTGFELRDSAGNTLASAVSGQDIQIALRYRGEGGRELSSVHVALGFHASAEQRLFNANTAVKDDFDRIPAEGTIICSIPDLPLQPGSYAFNLFSLVDDEIADWIQHAGVLEVAAGDFYGTGKLPPASQGPFLVRYGWRVTAV